MPVTLNKGAPRSICGLLKCFSLAAFKLLEEMVGGVVGEAYEAAACDRSCNQLARTGRASVAWQSTA